MGIKEMEAKILKIARDECFANGMRLKDIEYIYDGLRLSEVVIEAWQYLPTGSLGHEKFKLPVRILPHEDMYKRVKEDIHKGGWKCQ